MGKLKLQTSKKRVNQKKRELEAPDEVTTHLQRLSEHLNKHFKLYLTGLAGVIVVALAITWMVDRQEAQAVAQSKAITDASGSIVATVGEYGDEKLPIVVPGAEATETEPAFKTEAERWTAAAAKTKAAVEATEDELKAVAHALDARVKMAQGQAAEALKSYGYFAEAGADSSLMPLILENQGHAAVAAGDVGGAATHFEKLGQNENLYYKVRAQVLLGDLYNPSFGTKAADSAKAKQHYDAALEALTPTGDQVFNTSLRALRSEIKRRQALLQG